VARGTVVLVIVLVVVTLVSAATARASAPSVDVTVVPVATSFSAADPVRMRVTFENRGAAMVGIPTEAIPEDPLMAPLFAVERGGVPVRYTGALAKRVDDTILLAPGAAITRTVDLASGYEFASTGTYTVRYVGEWESIPVAIEVAGRRSLINRFEMSLLPPSYTSCTADQQITAATSLTHARTYAGRATAYLGGTAGLRYTTWFGAYDATRWNAVQSNFQAMANALNDETIEIHCAGATCTDSTYGYVYASSPYVIYVCGAFWAAPATGTDSQAGTLIHELSHFTVVAGTDDWVYGQSGARSLATGDPAKAIDNADSYEYFAENTPLQQASGYTLSATSVAFAGQTTGTSGSAATVQLTGIGDEVLVVGTIEVSGDFTLTANTCSGTTLAPAASCAISVVFSPTAAGARSGAVEIPSNAYMPLADIALSGTGVAPTPTPEPTPSPAPTTTTAAAAAPTPSLRATTVLARGAKRSVVVTIGPTGGGIRRFTVQRRVGAAWRTLPGTFTTLGRRTVRVPNGTYRIVVAAADAYGGATSGAVTVRR
jgi:peptidyl-Lys metalloendopeptidase